MQLRQVVGRLVPTVSKCLCGHTTRRTIIYSSKKDFSRNLIAFLQQDIDLRPVAIRRWKKEKAWEQLVDDHTLNPDRLSFLGPDLATTHFIIPRGGAIRFVNIDKWFEANEEGKVPVEIPNTFEADRPETHLYVEAIDASETHIMYCSFDNFGELKHLRYLDVSRCPNINDWALDRMVQFRDTLQYLNISGCPQITEKGIGTLHKLHNLRRLRMEDMPSVRYMPLVASMLEEVLPNCVIEGVDFTKDISKTETDAQHETFVQYEQQLHKAMKEDMLGNYFQTGRIKY